MLFLIYTIYLLYLHYICKYRLLQKHINAKKELEGQYNQERIKLEKGNLSTSKVVKRVNSAKTMKSPKGK